MSEHKNEPREVGYPKEQASDYRDFTKSDGSNSIFEGLTQGDIFLLALAVGASKNRKAKQIRSKQLNIPSSVFSEEQKWAILSVMISIEKDLLILMNEKQVYELAELYAAEGLEIIKSHISTHGGNYDKYLESELLNSLKKKWIKQIMEVNYIKLEVNLVKYINW